MTNDHRPCLCGHGPHDGRCGTCGCEVYQPKGMALPPASNAAGPAAAPTVEQILAAAGRSPAKRISGLAEKIRAQLDDLRVRLAEERHAAERRHREKQARQAARDRIAQLETQLKAERAKLRGATSVTPRPRVTDTPPSSLLPCPHDKCGRTFSRQQGLSRHINESHGGKR